MVVASHIYVVLGDAIVTWIPAFQNSIPVRYKLGDRNLIALNNAFNIDCMKSSHSRSSMHECYNACSQKLKKYAQPASLLVGAPRK